MQTHICLVSAQAAANLLPALDKEIKPNQVVLVVSRSMSEKADHMDAVLKEVGIATERILLSDEHDFNVTKNELLEWASSHEGGEVALNLTGGTKLMAIAAQTVASIAGWRTFYLDVDTDIVTWLDAPEPATMKLHEQLRLKHYLQSYGFSLSRPVKQLQVPLEKQQMMDTLVRQIGSLEKSLSQLNWIAQQAEDKRALRISLTSEQSDSLSLQTLLRNFEEAGALNVEGDEIIFGDESDRQFVKGGWLEQLTYQKVPLQIQDKAYSLEVQDGRGVKNELDVAFMAGNRLFVVECKTARMDQPLAPKANDTLYKLAENCRRIGGAGTRGMLVSYRSLRDTEKKLARALNIDCVCGPDIVRLQEKMLEWVRR